MWRDLKIVLNKSRSNNTTARRIVGWEIKTKNGVNIIIVVILRPTTAVENNGKKNQRLNYNKGRVNKGHHGTTNQHFYIYKERIICRSILLVDKSTLLVFLQAKHPAKHPRLNYCKQTNYSQGSDHSSCCSFFYT